MVIGVCLFGFLICCFEFCVLYAVFVILGYEFFILVIELSNYSCVDLKV